MRECETFKAFEKLINGFRDAAPILQVTAKYLRRRSKCPGKDAFDQYETAMNKALEEAIQAYGKLKKDK